VQCAALTTVSSHRSDFNVAKKLCASPIDSAAASGRDMCRTTYDLDLLLGISCVSRTELFRRLMIATLPANACRNLATGVLLGLKSSIPSLRLTALFWRFFGSSIVLVLSEAVLVIVIDVSMVRRAGFGDTIEFHRHSSRHRHASKERAT
jgi:hypothetical protein